MDFTVDEIQPVTVCARKVVLYFNRAVAVELAVSEPYGTKPSKIIWSAYRPARARCSGVRTVQLNSAQPNALRAIGFMVSFLAILVLAVSALVIAYRHKTINTGITYVAADQAPASTLSPTNGLVRRS